MLQVETKQETLVTLTLTDDENANMEPQKNQTYIITKETEDEELLDDTEGICRGLKRERSSFSEEPVSSSTGQIPTFSE